MIDGGKVIAEARAKVGLERFAAREAEAKLHRLADALNREGYLGPEGEQRIHVDGVYLVSNQLLLGKYREQNPWAEDADAGDALMIVGFPRTGSTKLFRLLSQDPRLMHMNLSDVVLARGLQDALGMPQ